MDQKNNRKMVLAIAGYTSASILGPMLLIGAFGFFLDRRFDSNPKFLLVSIGIAFIVSNILLFRKKKFLMKKNFINNNFETKKESQR